MLLLASNSHRVISRFTGIYLIHHDIEEVLTYHINATSRRIWKDNLCIKFHVVEGAKPAVL